MHLYIQSQKRSNQSSKEKLHNSFCQSQKKPKILKKIVIKRKQPSPLQDSIIQDESEHQIMSPLSKKSESNVKRQRQYHSMNPFGSFMGTEENQISQPLYISTPRNQDLQMIYQGIETESIQHKSQEKNLPRVKSKPIEPIQYSAHLDQSQRPFARKNSQGNKVHFLQGDQQQKYPTQISDEGSYKSQLQNQQLIEVMQGQLLLLNKRSYNTEVNIPRAIPVTYNSRVRTQNQNDYHDIERQFYPASPLSYTEKVQNYELRNRKIDKNLLKSEKFTQGEDLNGISSNYKYLGTIRSERSPSSGWKNQEYANESNFQAKNSARQVIFQKKSGTQSNPSLHSHLSNKKPPKYPISKYQNYIQNQSHQLQIQRKKMIELTEEANRVICHEENYEDGYFNQYSLQNNEDENIEKKFITVKYMLNQLIELFSLREVIKFQLRNRSYQILNKLYQEAGQFYGENLEVQEPIKIGTFQLVLKSVLENYEKSQIDIIVNNFFPFQDQLTFEEFSRVFKSKLNSREVQLFSKPQSESGPKQIQKTLIKLKRLFVIWIQEDYFNKKIKQFLRVNSELNEIIISQCKNQEQSDRLDIILIQKLLLENSKKSHAKKVKVNVFFRNILGNDLLVNKWFQWISTENINSFKRYQSPKKMFLKTIKNTPQIQIPHYLQNKEKGIKNNRTNEKMLNQEKYKYEIKEGKLTPNLLNSFHKVK